MRSYAFAVAAVCVALAVTALLLPLSDDPLFSPLVGTVVIVSVYYGVGPALAATAVGWFVALLVFVEPRWSLLPTLSGATRWGIGLVVALVLIWVSWTLRRFGAEAAERATEAERSTAVARDLHELAAALASAATPSEVAAALLTRVPDLLGSEGGSLGLVEGDELLVVDPAEGPRPALQPGLRLPLSTTAPITTAARTGEAAYAATRDEFAREYPDGARFARYAASALAVPLRVEGRVVGAIGFPFEQPQAVDENVLSLALVAAELGGQALGRSLVYERERSAREGLDRVARLVPRFADEPPETVAEAICVEAREMFDSDVAQLWKVTDGFLEVIWREPPSPDTPPGHGVEPQDYPGMQLSLERREPTFFPDARTTVQGERLERILAEGVRSVLRVPVVVSGRPEMLLALRWARVVPEPDAQTLALVRRFADHAGLVIEQGVRRRAEETEQIARARAERLAGDLAQLHALASSLGAASTRTEIAALVAGRVLAVAGAETVAVYDVGRSGGEPELLASVASDVALARNEDAVGPGFVAFPGDAPLPQAPRWLDDGVGDEQRSPSATLPLMIEGSPVGVLLAQFRPGHLPDEGTRRLVETIAGQAAQPLERARLHESEHEARIQAEVSARRTRRLQALTAAFSGALTPAEVAGTFLDETVEAVGASAAALALLDDEGHELHAVRSKSFPDALLGPEGIVPVTSSGPAATAVRVQEPPFYDDVELLVAAHPELRAALVDSDLRSFAFLPVSAGAAPLGSGRARLGAAGEARRRRARVPRGRCRAVRPLARSRAALRGRAGGGGDAAAERPAGDRCRRWRACGSPRCTFPARRRSTWAATGSTRSRFPTAASGSSSATSSGKGVQAAATMAQLRNGMRALTLDALTPARDRDEAQPPARELHRRAVRHAGLPGARPGDARGHAGLGRSSAAARRRAGRQDAVPRGRTRASARRRHRLRVHGAHDRARGRVDHRPLHGRARRASRPLASTTGWPVSRTPRDARPASPTRSSTRSSASCSAPRRGRTTSRCSPSCSTRRLLAPLELTLPADPDALPYLRQELERWLDSAAVPELDARDILLATWEAGANAIEHADAGDGAVVRVDAALSGDRVRIGVVDRGRWKEPEVRHDRGLGLRLIESLMATVDVERSRRRHARRDGAAADPRACTEPWNASS